MQGLAPRTATLACLLALGLLLPAPAAPQDPRPDEAVLFSITVSKRLVADRQGRTAVRVLCEDHTACSGALTIAGAPARRPQYARTSFTVPPASAARIRMTLNRRGRRALARKGKLSVIVFSTVMDGANNVGFAQLPTTIALVKKRKR